MCLLIIYIKLRYYNLHCDIHIHIHIYIYYHIYIYIIYIYMIYVCVNTIMYILVHAQETSRNGMFESHLTAMHEALDGRAHQ